MRKLFIPEELNLPALLEQNGLGRLNTPTFIEKCHYFINCLHIRRVRYDKKWSDYLPVSSRRFKAIFYEKHAALVKKHLVGLGIIEVLKKMAGKPIGRGDIPKNIALQHPSVERDSEAFQPLQIDFGSELLTFKRVKRTN